MWSTRFARSGLDGLVDEPGRGRKASISAAKVARIITEATRPPPGRSRWSIRSMAQHSGISASSVQRIWSDNDIKPHRVKTFKLSNDPSFEEKSWNVIGLYLGSAVECGYVGRGYREHGLDHCCVFISGLRRGITEAVRPELRRCSAIELPFICWNVSSPTMRNDTNAFRC